MCKFLFRICAVTEIKYVPDNQKLIAFQKVHNSNSSSCTSCAPIFGIASQEIVKKWAFAAIDNFLPMRIFDSISFRDAFHSSLPRGGSEYFNLPTKRTITASALELCESGLIYVFFVFYYYSVIYFS